MSDVPNTEAVAWVLKGVLEGINAVYEQEGVSLPEKQYIAMNTTAHDCQQLTVAFQQMYSGPPGNQLEEPVRCETPRSVVMQVQLVRCIPTMKSRGQEPSPEEMIASTEELLADVWLLTDGVLSSEPAQWLGAITDVSVTDPSGGFQAVQLNVVMAVQ